jgi:type VI secretion system secreted protein Hcp
LVALLALGALWVQPAEPVEAQANGSPVATFVRFDGIDGEATERNHEGWSTVESINTSVFRPSSASARTRSRADFEDLILVKTIDAAGPYLQLAAWNGRVIPTVEIEIVGTGELRPVLWEIELRNVAVTSYSMGTTGQDDLTPNSLPLVATSMYPTEQVTLDFEKATVRYFEMSDDGSIGAEHEVEFDIAAGK